MEVETCIEIKNEIDDEEINEINLDNNTILVYSEDGVETEYEPYAVENGQVILRRVDQVIEDRLEDSIEVISTELISNEEISKEVVIDKPDRKDRFLTKKIPERRKLSYENDFKPWSFPANRGGIKGIIRYGRKHLIIDQQTMISPREFKEQLNDSSDIIMKAELAPATKKQMRYVISGMTRLFAYPSHKITNSKLLKLYMANCTTKKTQDEEHFTDMELKPLGFKTEIDPSKIKRITRKRKYPEAEQFLKQQEVMENEIIEINGEILSTNESQTTNELIEAARNAQDNDHIYTKQEEFETVFIKPDDQQIYIMQSVDENGVLKNIEVLLAAAETTDEITEIKEEEIQNETIDDSNEPQKIYFVQDDNNEVLCLQGEFILS